jgi:hypothetical protein
MAFTNLLATFISSKKRRLAIVCELRNLLYDKSMEFWKERCSFVKEIDKQLKIDKNSKKIAKISEYNKNFQFFTDIYKDNNFKLENNLDGLRNKIYFGGKILDYYSTR